MSLRHTVTVECDKCAISYVIGPTHSRALHRTDGWWISAAEALEKAELNGWLITSTSYLCPDCRAYITTPTEEVR